MRFLKSLNGALLTGLFLLQNCHAKGDVSQRYGGDFMELIYVFALLIGLVAGIAIYSRLKKRQVTINHFKTTWPNPLVITRENGRVTFVNPAFENRFGSKPKFIYDLELSEILDFNNLCHTFLDTHLHHSQSKKVFTSRPAGGSVGGLRIDAIKQEHEIFWYFQGHEVGESGTLFDETEFQKSLDVRYLFNRTPAGNVILDDEGRIEGTNQTFQRQFNNQVNPEVGLLFQELLSEKCLKEFKDNFAQYLRESVGGIPLELEFKNGHQAVAYYSTLEFSSCMDGEKLLKGYYLQIFDNIEQKQMQQRMAHSQKLQALGQLAGGIAHDFNNLLTAIIGFCDLLLMRHAPGDQSFTDLMQIKQNANRATNLVRQLLAFSKQQTLQPRILDVSEMLSDLSLLLQRLIGSKIDLKISHGKGVGHIKADQGQFEQVIINLVVNARDAISDKGTIRLVTSIIDANIPKVVGNEVVPAGTYVQIEVMDDGTGISHEHINRIFDPFFSTKDLSAGTGLGLSTVYGIVKQSGGFILVESTPKVGTKFTILFPQNEEKVPGAVQTIASGEKQHKDLTGSGDILLAEDEEAVRLFAARALVDKGYNVIEVSDGSEGLAYLKSKKNIKDFPKLLITDVVMPNMDGPALVKEARKLHPDLKVLFVSGYAEDSFRAMLSKEPGIMFLAKPFSLKDLATKVKSIIEEPVHSKSVKEKAS